MQNSNAIRERMRKTADLQAVIFPALRKTEPNIALNLLVSALVNVIRMIHDDEADQNDLLDRCCGSMRAALDYGRQKGVKSPGRMQ